MADEDRLLAIRRTSRGFGLAERGRLSPRMVEWIDELDDDTKGSEHFVDVVNRMAAAGVVANEEVAEMIVAQVPLDGGRRCRCRGVERGCGGRGARGWAGRRVRRPAGRRRVRSESGRGRRRGRRGRMIVEVSFAITTDDGMLAVLAVERRLVVQTYADFEGNALKAAAALDDAAERCAADAKRQVVQVRGTDPMLRPPLPNE